MISFRAGSALLFSLLILQGLIPETALAAGNAPQPSICTRGCWGARAPRSVSYMSALTKAVVHHTAGNEFGTTGYEASKANVRAIQNYHMDTQGWSDIAYHFLVDKFGYTFEGRSGSMTSWVLGSHTYGNNTNTFGFNAMGYFHPPVNNVPTQAQLDALEAVIAWRMPNGFNASANLFGHYQLSASACPGDGMISRLNSVRDDVNARINGAVANNPSYYFDSGSQGWNIGGNAMTGPVWQAPGGWPGIVYGDQTGNDGFWWGPDTNYTGGGDPCVNIQVYPQSGSSANHDMQLFWRTSEEDFFSGDKSSQLSSYVAQNGWYSVNLSLNNPKYWGKNIKAWRLDFDNNNVGARFIVNHMLLQTTPRYFFGGGTDGWNPIWGVTPLVWQSDGTWGDIIYCDQNANDAHIESPRVPGGYMLGGANDYVLVRLYPQSGNSASHDMQVFWKTNTEDFYSADKSTAIVNYTAQNNWIEVWLNCGANPKWAGSFVSQIRLDFDQVNKGNRWIVDHVMVHHI